MLHNLPLNCSYNATLKKCIILIGIYQLFILQFTVVIERQSNYQKIRILSSGPSVQSVDEMASSLLKTANNKICRLCVNILSGFKGYCKKYKLGMPFVIVMFIVMVLFFQYICIKCCIPSKSRKKKKKGEGFCMNSYDPHYERPHGHSYQGRLYGENMKQHMFQGDGMHPNKYQKPFLYGQEQEPRKKKKKKQEFTDLGPTMEQTNDEEQKTRPKKKKKKKKDGQTKGKNKNHDVYDVGYSQG